MAWLPKSRKARRRLAVVAVAGAVLAGAGALAFYALDDAVSFFYSPSQALAAKVPAGRVIQLGGMVKAGSVVKHPDGSTEFVVADQAASSAVYYKGDLPDLFREGQGVVTKGAYTSAGRFEAIEVLAKHDEKYMPKELTKALKESGEWRRGEASYAPSAAGSSKP
jgi:cytochrome c-type biogenesis protein CcmE